MVTFRIRSRVVRRGLVAAVALSTAATVLAPSAGAVTADGLATPAATADTDPPSPPFTRVEAFATKTGFRGVVAWQASVPVAGAVNFGTSPTALTSSVVAVPGGPDTAQVAVFDGLVPGTTYFYEVEDLLSGATSGVRSFTAANAYTDWDGRQYTLDLLVQLDAQSLPADVGSDLVLADIAQGMSIFAERLYDATDGYARLGKVLVTDDQLAAANYPNLPVGTRPPVCDGALDSNMADVIVQTTVPFDSHTWGGFAINDPCTSFSIGREGQLVIPWEDDLHLGYVSTHEMMHYAFNAPDLYLPEHALTEGGCVNDEFDISVMDNSGGWAGDHWAQTELDREDGDRLCTMFNRGNTWDAMRARYTNIPDTTSEQIVDNDEEDRLARGAPDGDALEIIVLDRTPGVSSLTSFVPNDNGLVTECPAAGPVATDVTGDTLLPTNTSLDLVEGRVSFDPAADAGRGAVSFAIGLDDISAVPPVGSTGEQWAFNFRANGIDYFTTATRYGPVATEFSLSKIEVDPVSGVNNQVEVLGQADGVTGSVDEATEVATVTIPLGPFNALPDPDLAGGSPLSGITLEASRIAATHLTGGAIFAADDTAASACTYLVGQELSAPPTAADDVATAEQDGPAVFVDVLANDTDPDGDALSIVGVGAAQHGVAAMAPGGGSVTYTPAPGFTGDDSFTYEITDGVWRATGTVHVDVIDVQNPPMVTDDAAVVTEDGVVSIDVLANDRDADGDDLTIVAVGSPAHGQVAAGSAGLAYAPAPDFSGADSFTYTVRDPAGLEATGTVSVTVTPVNDAPAAVADSASTKKNKQVVVDVLANDGDADGDALRLVAVSVPANGGTAEILADGTILFRPRRGFGGVDSFGYTVADRSGAASTATVTVAVG